jgi:hypothetical protein
LAYNFNNSPFSPPGPPDGALAKLGDESHGALGTSAPAADPPADSVSVSPTPATSDSPQSGALVRFRSCRWQQPAENGNQEFCTHREVKPYAGTAGFDADAWCPECQYYKLRRAPKKREPRDDYSY